MDDNVSHSDMPETTPVPDNRALHIVALFVVVIATFLLHFNMLYAPMQGDEFALLLFDDALHRPDTAMTAPDRLPGSPLSVFVIGLFWRLGMPALRAIALLSCMMSAAFLFVTIRLWSARTESVAAPLLGALLFAASPAVTVALGALNALPVVLGVLCAAAACFFVLKAAADSKRPDYLYLVLACCAQALAVAAHYGLALLPLLCIIVELLRLRADGRPRLTPVWPVWAAVAGTAIACAAVVHYSGDTLWYGASRAALPYYGSAFVALTAAWLLAVLPLSLMRHGLIAVLVAAVLGGGALSFRQALPYVEPTLRLEQQIAVSDDPALHTRLALHYLDEARRATNPEDRFARTMEAVAVLGEREATDKEAVATRRLLGEALLEQNRVEEAAELLAPFLETSPFDAAGHNAAIALAQTAADRKRTADYYGFALRAAMLESEDITRFAVTAMQLGDMAGAAQLFALLPELDEDSAAGQHRQQMMAVRNAARSLQEAANEQIRENPQEATGYMTLAESQFLQGNLLRTFYWLELAMRRDQDLAGAWELMGALFAQHNQAVHFVTQWGAMRARADQAWLRLSRQAALFQAWDAAHTYAAQFATDDTLSAEEFLAAFAIEMRLPAIARGWLERAASARPTSYTPWLAQADLAMALQQPETARAALDEARKRDAPPEEIEKRVSLIEGTPTQTEPRPFEPVRTYIQ